jgi:PAS domain-containing protein
MRNFRRTPVCAKTAGRNVKHAYGEISYATAAEVSRSFGRWQDQALAGPVVVTHHGRPRVVVLSALQYEAMTEAQPPGGLAEDSPETARLQEALAALQAFQNVTAGGAIRLTRRGIVAAIDEAVARGLGVTGAEAVGAPLTDLIDSGERRRVTAALEACFEDGVAARLELSRLGRTGDEWAVTLGVAPVLRDGLIDGVVIAVTPTTPAEASIR